MGIMDKLEKIRQTKEEIRNAITAKGVEITEKDAFELYAGKIREIGGTKENDEKLYHCAQLNHGMCRMADNIYKCTKIEEG